MIYLKLFWEFFRVGLFSIGGGLATLPFLYELSEKTGWFASSEIVSMLAVSEATPGAVGVNMATYAGFSVSGIPGAIVATFGLVAPSILVVTVVFLAFQKLRQNQTAQSILTILRPTSLALIVFAGITVFKNALLTIPEDLGYGAEVRWKQVLICLITGLVWKRCKCHPVFILLLAALLGALL